MKSYLTWHGTANPSWLLSVGLLAVVAAGLIIWLYRYERQLISRPLGWTLLLLRLSVVGLVFTALLEPVRITEIDRERTGRILVSVDVSESMETIDAHAKPAEQLRWARALGMIGNAEINDRLDRWQAAYDAGREPEWVEADEAGDPQRRRQLADARRDNLQGVFDQLAQLPRREIARRLLVNGSDPVLKQLEKLGLLEVSMFAGQTEAVPSEELSKSLEAPDESLVRDETDIAQPVSPVLGGTDDVPVAGVVLLTDGRHNTRESESRLINRLAGVAAPVYPVLIGSEERPKDLSFGSLDYPRQPVSQDDRPLIRVALRTAGYEGQDVEITLTPADGSPGEPQTRTVRVTGPVSETEFSLEAPELGRFQYTVSTPVRAGETRDDNNARSFSISVVDDEADVLLVEGEGRWEFRFLDNALRRDEQIKLQEVLFRQPFMRVLAETFFPRRLDVPQDPSRTVDSPFAPFDVVILGDVPQAQLPPAAWELLDRFVRDEGGTLVIQAGKRHMPLGYNRNTILEGLLPVTGLRTLNRTGREDEAPPSERGFRLTLTPDGKQETFLRFSEDAEENDRIWDDLPGQTWGLIGEAKGEATVLASVLPAGAKQNLQTERENAVIVRQQAGFGQVLWIGIDGTWRWRHRVGDQYHHRFWGQLARWGARFKAFAKNENVAFGPVQPSVELGEDAVFRATWNRNFLQRFPQLTARGIVTRLDDPTQAPVQTFDLAPSAAGPLDYEGRAIGLRPGDYRVRLAVDSGELDGDEVVAELQVQEPSTSELSDISANRPLLETIAQFTEGKLLLPHELSELPQIFRGVTESSTLRSEQPLWDSWPMLLLFFGLLTLEWVLRKVNGLP
ncbi:MAG: hypothetical protein KDA75_00210 [Planctomycetaceae bacterium]|nr:hypothetical protein [Planctomycetaceae bacterium]